MVVQIKEFVMDFKQNKYFISTVFLTADP